MIWLHCLLAALILGFVLWSRRRVWARAVVWSGVALAAALLLAAASTWPGLLAAQRMLAPLALPCGLLWLAIIAMTLLAWHRQQRTTFRCLLTLLVLLTIFGNNLVNGLLSTWLESPYASIDPLESGPFDAVLVLGGATSTTRSGYTQLNASGDRVALAARLYHAGRTQRLVCAGRQLPSRRTWTRDPAQEVRTVWRELAVASEDIISSSGRNTREELVAFARLIEREQWQRAGLITSAWHMRRAMRLSRALAVKLEPLPADFRGGLPAWSQVSLIPDAGQMSATERCVKEVLAMALGR